MIYLIIVASFGFGFFTASLFSVNKIRYLQDEIDIIKEEYENYANGRHRHVSREVASNAEKEYREYMRRVKQDANRKV